MTLSLGKLHVDLGSEPAWLLMMLFACACMLGMAGTQIRHALAAQLFWLRTEGRVLTIERKGVHQRVPYTRFAFTAPDGRDIRARTPYSSAFHPAKTGEAVTVAHHPDKPERADLLHTSHLYGFPCVFLLFAAGFGWLAARHFDGVVQLHRPTPSPK